MPRGKGSSGRNGCKTGAPGWECRGLAFRGGSKGDQKKFRGSQKTGAPAYGPGTTWETLTSANGRKRPP